MRTSIISGLRYSVLCMICCRNMHGPGITIFSSKATLTACPLVLAS